MANHIHISRSLDGRRNLAVDEWFLDHVREGELILHFYVNENAVIIGKNQNPWKECALDRMREDGVTLVRRISGGGAVYHDKGNLNFSFIAGKGRWDKERQHRLILNAVRALGIPCEFSGRNDLLANGKKFSGNAYCARGDAQQHHGTLLVSSDLDRLSNYLTADPRKLKAKGVSSVRARVCLLNEFLPGLTTDRLRDALICAFAKEYAGNGDVSPFVFTAKDPDEIETYFAKHSSDEWLYGKTPPFDCEIDLRLSYGTVNSLISLKEGRVSSVKTYTDANDDTFPQRLEKAIFGLPFDRAAIAGALRATDDPLFAELADSL